MYRSTLTRTQCSPEKAKPAEKNKVMYIKYSTLLGTCGKCGIMDEGF